MDPEAIVDEFIRRVVAKNLDAACELVDDDVEYDNVPMGKNHGPEGIKALLGGMVGVIDEIEFVILRQTVTGNVVMNERVDRFRVGDRWADLPVMGVFETNTDGKIVLWRDYFDLATFTTQFGSLNP